MWRGRGKGGARAPWLGHKEEEKKGGVVPSRVYKKGEEKRECRVSGEGGCHAMPM
jgi:hypothetical protein